MTKILKDIDISFISLVRKGANGRTVIFKSADVEPAELKQVQAVKKDDVKQMIYGIVYAPDEVDAHEHTATAREIEKAAHRFMKNLRACSIDKNHDERPSGDAFVAESWIVRAGDPLFCAEPEGAWAVGIKCESEELYREAQTNLPGISMAGTATVVSKADDTSTDGLLLGLLRKIIKTINGEQKQENNKMDENKVADMIAAAIKKSEEGRTEPLTEDKLSEIIGTVIKEAQAPLAERLEKLEKQTEGSVQDEQETADDIQKQVEAGERIAKIAMRHVRKEG